ncbi:uncharacterized protein JCM15063_004697 [Sporobolomyces koalae]|uniref:uncharacterized protein n=1 Tax=Sporobolomyces koalae TaxID=500713 RepID=UPI00316B917E
MSDESFAAIDAMLNHEVHLVTSLSAENARLRALIELEQTPASAPTPASLASDSSDQVDLKALLAELEATRLRQAEMARELSELRLAQTSEVSFAKEDQSNEVALLRASLANLAEQLETEKHRVTEIEAKRKEEEDKVAILRSKVEDSRRALMRLQGESTKRASIDASNNLNQGFSFPTRRSSFLEPNPRRRSSLGLSAISGSPSLGESITVGLGLGVEQQSPSSFAAKSSSATPLARFAHRRGSASLSQVADDEDRTARLRDLRLGVISTKISSRRNSAISGVPDFLAPEDFALNLSNRITGGGITSRRNRGSVCESEADFPDDLESGPPSAGLRLRGRRESTAVFEQSSRRSSGSEAAFSVTSDFTGGTVEDLKLQLEGLRIQLAESEEGRRASELCLQALKEFISKSDANSEAVSLPPLPSDSKMDAPDTTIASRFGSSSSLPRWSIPRLSIGSRRESVQSNASSTSPDKRRTSISSNLSTSTLAQHDKVPSSSLPSFGGFSFSALVSRSTATSVSGDTSPTAPACALFPSSPRESDTFSVDPVSVANSDHEQDDAMSTAPSLVEDLSSSPASSRASSPSPRTSDVGLVVADIDQDSLVTDAARLTIDVEKPANILVTPTALAL